MEIFGVVIIQSIPLYIAERLNVIRVCSIRYLPRYTARITVTDTLISSVGHEYR